MCFTSLSIYHTCLVTTIDSLRSNQERKYVLHNHQCQPFVCRKGLSICSTPSTGATVITEVPRATMRPRVRSFPLRRYGSLASGESTMKKEGWKFSCRYSQGIERNGISTGYIKVSTKTLWDVRNRTGIVAQLTTKLLNSFIQYQIKQWIPAFQHAAHLPTTSQPHNNLLVGEFG